jgi:hypothetical protein
MDILYATVDKYIGKNTTTPTGVDQLRNVIDHQIRPLRKTRHLVVEPGNDRKVRPTPVTEG